MGNVHRLILQHGVDAVRAGAESKADRMMIEAAAAILGEEESRLGITHFGSGKGQGPPCWSKPDGIVMARS